MRNDENLAQVRETHERLLGSDAPRARKSARGSPLECRRQSVDRLVLGSAAGVWRVSSASATRYFLDLDARLLLRQPGELSATGPYDGVWVQLLKVSNLQETGVIQVGLRHRYDLDPDPGGPADFRWWVQRTATGIDPVALEDRPVGRAADPNEDWHPYLHPRTEAAPPSTLPEDGADGRA